MKALYKLAEAPFKLLEVNLTDADDKDLLTISKELGLALNLLEMKAIKEYFYREGRNPTDVELQTLGQTWSEHCFHKTFKGVILYRGKLIKNPLKTYIMRVTEELNKPWCFSVFTDNAGIVKLNDEYGIAVKVETHNHPSAIDPFGGAATGIGGVIRDILGVWAEPIALTDVLCFGPLELDYRRLPKGVKHPSYLFRGVVAGIGYYGNNMGVPTVNGAVYFDEGYIGNIAVYCGCVGLLPLNRYVKNVKPGDIIIVAGGKTGRDGIHGVTFASAELTEKSEDVSRPAVQIPNPIEEEKLRRAILKVRDEGLSTYITDLGGGGLSSAISETCYRYGCGALVHLEKVHLKDMAIEPWEIWISESQERMLLVAPPDAASAVIDAFQEEDVDARVIGNFTDEFRLTVKYNGYTVVSLDIDFLFRPPVVKRKAYWEPLKIEEKIPPKPDLVEAILRVLSSYNIRSREEIVRTYDHEVRGSTVLKPFQGDNAGPNDAAVIRPLKDERIGIVISSGIKPSYGKIDPYWMAASSIDEAIRNNVAVGGRRIAILDNFVWGNPEKPDRLGSLMRAIEACYDFAKLFDTPFISGKDSLYNESPAGPINPTLLITAIGIIPDIKMVVSSNFKKSGNSIYIIGMTYNELGGSEYFKLYNGRSSKVPKVRSSAKRIMDFVVECIDNNCLKACHDISSGGIAIALSEMAIGGNIGISVYLSRVPRSRDLDREDLLLFSESNSRFIAEVDKEKEEFFVNLARKYRVIVSKIGRITGENSLVLYDFSNKPVEIRLSDIISAWKKSLL